MQKLQIAILFSIITALFSCHQETIEDKAERDAKEYTHRFCPTPSINGVSTDSVTYSRKTNIYTYHCTFSGTLDDQEVIDDNKERICDILRKSVLESTYMKPYVEAGFRFEYICRSEKDSKVVLFRILF